MKKHHWHTFWHEKLFEKHPQLHCQTRSKSFMKSTIGLQQHHLVLWLKEYNKAGKIKYETG